MVDRLMYGLIGALLYWVFVLWRRIRTLEKRADGSCSLHGVTHDMITTINDFIAAHSDVLLDLNSTAENVG